MLRLGKQEILRVLSSSVLPNRLRRIPLRVRRPSATRKALGFSPLVQAGGAYSACVEGVPIVPALAEPAIILARRPAAERTADARFGRIVALLFIEFAIQNHGGVGWGIREGAHAPPLCPSSHPRVWRTAPLHSRSVDMLRKEA